MTATPEDDLRDAVARELIRAKFGEEGVIVLFSPPVEATAHQRAVLAARANQARREADAILAGPLASHTATLRAEVERVTADQRAMLIQVGEHARARGEAEGALAISEKAGIVEGWRTRALAAEAEAATLRAELASAHREAEREGQDSAHLALKLAQCEAERNELERGKAAALGLQNGTALVVRNLEAELARVRDQLAGAVESLGPFAALCGSDNLLDPDADHQNGVCRDSDEWFRHDGFVLTVGDFRRARTTLASLTPKDRSHD